MIKALSKIRIRTLLLFSAQILVIAAFFALWHFDVFSLKDVVTIEAIALGLMLFTLIDIVFVTSIIARISKIRHKADLRAAEIIGSDVQEAYNFGAIGLLVVDESDVILWTNELFAERQINVMDLNVFEWQPKLRELKNSEEEDFTVKVDINSHIYEVKYLPDAMLYILKDVSEFESLYKYSKEQSPVVGVLMIDNYADVVANLDDNSDTVANIRKAIAEYAKKHGLLLRRYRSDAYFALCTYKSFEVMRANDQFSLLDAVRGFGAGDETPLTLSMGFAYDFPDVIKLNDMAVSAMDIAMSRGGDQVVVSRYGDELAFFGGKTEAQEKRNKVKVRVMADSLVGLIKASSNVLIMSHADMDLDALGSALGVKAICDHLNKNSLVVYDPKNTERKTRNAVTTMFSREELGRIMISPQDCLEKLKNNTLVIITDVHRPSMTTYPKLLEEATKVVVIDHHRRGEEFIESPVFNYVEPSASSASELVAELIRYSSSNPKISVPSSYATIMLAGIFLDTNYYRAKTAGMRTFEASMILKEFGAENSQADDFLKDEYEEYALKTKIMSNTHTPYYGVVVAQADDKDYIERATLAKVANQSLQIKGINAVFVIGNSAEKETRMSARSDGSINVQLLLEKMGGGGHFTSAAAVFTNSSITEVNQKLEEVLEQYLSVARSTYKK